MLITRSPLRVIYGEDALDHLAGELNRLGARRPMLLHPRSMTGSVTVSEVQARAKPAVTFGEVQAHSPIETVLAAARQGVTSGVDSLLAVGGGSVAVTCRAVAIAIAEGSDLDALATHRDDRGRLVSPRLNKAKMPIFVVPTTPSTAYGKAGTAVTVVGSGDRLTMFDPKTRAACVLVVPEALATAPPHLVRDAGLNTFVMAAEGMTTRTANLFSDADLAQALSVLARDLGSASGQDTAEEPPPGGARLRVVLAALLCGAGTDQAGGGLTAALAHTLGHTVKRHNGIIDAVLLPHVLAHMTEVSPQRLTNLALQFGCNASDLPSVTGSIFARLSAQSRLRDLDVEQETLPLVASHALNDFAVQTSGCKATIDTLRGILEAAW
jgi:alcohol dehydrogenase class IV